MKNSTEFNIKKRTMLEALATSMGVVQTAAAKAGLDRSTHYVWMNSDPAYAEAVKELRNIALDFAESKLLEKINGIVAETKDGKNIYSLPPDTTAIIFFLKTIGKDRGYVERSELNLSAPKSNITIEVVGEEPNEEFTPPKPKPKNG